MCWDILEIKPTTDKKTITMAYRQKLVNTNPEEKPEQFKALREAYEQALAYAESGGVAVKTPIELWKEQLAELYDDFARRIQVDCWKELLEQPICKSIDTRGTIEEALLTFMLEHYVFSQNVMIYLNEQFDFVSRVDELYETYPRDFVDYILVGSVVEEERVPCDLFYPGVDGVAVEQYISLFNKAKRMGDDAKELFQQMRQLPEQHPYGDAFMLLIDINEGNAELQQLQQLTERYQYRPYINNMYVTCLLNSEEYEKAQQYCEKALDNYPEDYISLKNLAMSLAGQQLYREAIDCVQDLMRIAGGDEALLSQLDEMRKEYGEKSIEIYQKQFEENPIDNDRNIYYAWSLLQNERYEEAAEIASYVQKEEVDEFDYYNLKSSIALSLNKDDSIELLDHLIEIISNLKDDGTEKTQKRMNRLSEMMVRKAYQLCTNGNLQEGIETYKQALEISPDNGNVLTTFITMCLHYGEFEEAAEYARKLIKLMPMSYHGYLLLAHSCFKLFEDSEAFECVNRAIELNANVLECYTLKLRILIRNNAKDAVEELLSFLEENGCQDVLDVKYCKANQLEFFNDDNDGAFKLYEEIIEAIRNGEDCSVEAETFYRYLIHYGSHKDSNKKKDCEEMLAIAEEGIETNPNHYGLRDYKAWLLMKLKRNDEALALYKELAQLPDHSPEVEYQIAIIYYQNSLEQNADQVIEYMTKALDRGYEYGRFELVYSLYYTGRYEEAEKQCLILREEEAKDNNIDVDSYNRMSYIYQKQRRYQEAIEQAIIAVENALKRNIRHDRYYRHLIMLYRITGQVEKAIETAQQMGKNTDSKIVNQQLTEIYLQFGMYKQAREIITKRLSVATNIDTSNACRASIKLHLLEGKLARAKFSLFDHRAVMDPIDCMVSEAAIDEYDGKFIETVNTYLKYNEQLKGEETVHSCARIAEAYLLVDDEENAIKLANKALELYNKKREKFTDDRALDNVSLARIYIVLNRLDEAQQLLQQARADLCSSCSYCACKDADYFELLLLMRQGNYDLAKEKCQKAIELWKDEEDFVVTRQVLKKKYKK